MSDSYMISLGIGSPASIPRFVLFGLSQRITGTVDLSLEDRHITGLTLPDRPLSLTLPKRHIADLTLKDR